MPKKTIKPKLPLSSVPLPALPPVEDVEKRLKVIFPETMPDRGILVGIMAARVIFVFLYGGFIEGHGRYLRPSHVYFFTKEQAAKNSDAERTDWLSVATRPGNRPEGERWYADTSKETIRDDLMRNRLLPLGIMHKRTGEATTAMTPINFISADFAALFDPALTDEEVKLRSITWQEEHLDQATLQRMALRAKGIQTKDGDVFIEMPDGTRIRISGGPSAPILKGLIEDYATKHLQRPAVLWLSASDKKSYPQGLVARAGGCRRSLCQRRQRCQ
ncbi:MAG: hypothetical protein ACLP29_11545 [Dissulfurispiraceae bacterium]